MKSLIKELFFTVGVASEIKPDHIKNFFILRTCEVGSFDFFVILRCPYHNFDNYAIHGQRSEHNGVQSNASSNS